MSHKNEALTAGACAAGCILLAAFAANPERTAFALIIAVLAWVLFTPDPT